MTSTLTTGPARRVLRAAAATGVAAVALGVMPASAGAAPQAADAGTAQAAAAKSYTYLSYKKNVKDPTNSRLSLVYVQVVNPDKVRTYTVDSWRAGSGLGGKKGSVGQNECASSRGWLPNGSYNVEFFRSNYSGRINGIVWKLSNHKCKTGKVTRTELFIHSEMKSNGKPGSTESTRWDGNSDYKSEGCIKLKPADVRELKGYRSNYPLPQKLYVS
ncbi:hypothetical protein ABT160_34660 [Streptomyces sp. NPDC001941]|uniref:hypothetical protein n=1 Tax=Streptomyces sp. NPDC001941 TaxID=3154659 RepID=UPI0033259B41